MNWLNKMPGYQRTPYGFELRLLRKLPGWTLVGTLAAVLASVLARFYFDQGSIADIARRIQSFDIAMIAVVVLVWTAALTIAIGCIIVWLMKGPAYVADGYEVSHSDKPNI